MLQIEPENDFTKCERLTSLTPVSEATVLECLHQRFKADTFYTLNGSTVVALNPFKEIPDLYNTATIRHHHNGDKELPPHIFMIGEKAYTDLVRELGKVDQCIVVSGESGAGKTVTAKHLLRYLTTVSGPEKSLDLDQSASGSEIESRVLDSNPILEAFGNAATPRNENSSRFGKFIQLQFHRSGVVLGGVIQTYLLEKTRVVHQGEGENNFHIFYQMMSLLSQASLPPWLASVREDVTKANLSLNLPQEEDTYSLLATVDAMSDIGISTSTQAKIFQMLLSILHLCHVTFVHKPQDEEACDINQHPDCQWHLHECSRLLGISPLTLQHSMVYRNIISGTAGRGSVFLKPVRVHEAQSRRDCLAMLLYARLFDWLVSFINHQIKADHFDHTISLLDIYGFETFKVNSLEQLCINYANERLQQHYVMHFLRDLQTEYESEQIPWHHIEYRDNRICVATLDRTSGLFGLLNEEVYLNRESADAELCQKLVRHCKQPDIVRKPGAGSHITEFYVRHYAGEVLYTVKDVLVKNKDNIPPELVSLMRTSEVDFVHHLFTSADGDNSDLSQTTNSKTKKKKTVLAKFKSSLDALLESLHASEVHYIRCIKPNEASHPGKFDPEFVLQQLRACGTLEAVKICQNGYPARLSYSDFVGRYGTFLRLSRASPCYPSHLVRGDGTQGDLESEQGQRSDKAIGYMEDWLSQHSCVDELREIILQCAEILCQVFSPSELEHSQQQFGLTKIFLTQVQLDHLEKLRSTIIFNLLSRMQACWKAKMATQHLADMRAASVTIQAQWRAVRAQRSWKKLRSEVIRLQRWWRAVRLRQKVLKLTWAVNVITSFLEVQVRRYRFKRELCRLKKEQYEALQSQNLSAQKPGDIGNGIFTKSVSESNQGQSPSDSAMVSLDQTDSNLSPTRHSMFDHDSDSDSSIDSGVIDDEKGQYIPDSPQMQPSLRKKRIVISSRHLRMGRGILTCRRLTRHGYRFHVKVSILKYNNVIPHREMPQGLPDAVDDDLDQCDVLFVPSDSLALYLLLRPNDHNCS